MSQISLPRSSTLLSLLRHTTRRTPSSATRIVRGYGSDSAKSQGSSHGGQPPTQSSMGETGSSAPSADQVAKSSAAFDSSKPDPKSASEGVEKDLPSGQTMDNTASNPAISQTKTKGDQGVPDATASGMNSSDSSQGGRRSQRGPGKEV